MIGDCFRNSDVKVIFTGLAICTRTANGSGLAWSGDRVAMTDRFAGRLGLEATLLSTALSMSSD